MIRKLTKGEGTNFYINDSSITRGTIVVDWFPHLESVRLRYPNERAARINISPYTDYVNGETGQPFSSFNELRSWIKANVNAIDTPATSDTGNTTSSNVKVTNTEGNAVNTKVVNVLHTIVDNVLHTVIDTLPNVNLAPGQSIDISSIVHAVIDSLPPIDIASMPNITLATQQKIGIDGVIHALIDNFPANLNVTVSNPTPAAPSSVSINNTSAIPVSIGSVIHTIIDSLPSMTLAPGQTVNIGNVIHAIIDTLPDVKVTSMPKIELMANQVINIGTMPGVAVSSMPSVTVGALPAVSLSPNQIVGISGNITLATGQSINVSNVIHAIIDSMPNINAVITPSATSGYKGKFKIQPSGAGGNFTVVKSSPGVIGTMILNNSGTSTLSLLLYDKATTPISSDVPVQIIPIPAGSTLPIRFEGGMGFDNGIGIGFLADTNLLNIVAALLTVLVAGKVTVNINYV